MHSAFYEGDVFHRRFGPARHEFRYRLYLSYLDLDELPDLLAPYGLFSTSRFAPARFRREDHLGDPRVPLSDTVRELVFQQTGFRPAGPIRLLTQLQMWGYYFSPLNLFYCFDAAGQNVDAVLAEVSNTPWQERHPYVLWQGNLEPAEMLPSALGAGAGLKDAGLVTTYRHRKAFHVSPFMHMNFDYRWQLSTPAEQLSVRLENYEDETRLFDATLSLRRRPWSAGHKLRLLLRYPVMTGQIITAIYFEALRLWLKKCPYFPHPTTNVPPTPPPSTNAAGEISAEPVLIDQPH